MGSLGGARVTVVALVLSHAWVIHTAIDLWLVDLTVLREVLARISLQLLGKRVCGLVKSLVED